jgi:hypothetical protein
MCLASSRLPSSSVRRWRDVCWCAGFGARWRMFLAGLVSWLWRRVPRGAWRWRPEADDTGCACAGFVPRRPVPGCAGDPGWPGGCDAHTPAPGPALVSAVLRQAGRSGTRRSCRPTTHLTATSSPTPSPSPSPSPSPTPDRHRPSVPRLKSSRRAHPGRRGCAGHGRLRAEPAGVVCIPDGRPRDPVHRCHHRHPLAATHPRQPLTPHQQPA